MSKATFYERKTESTTSATASAILDSITLTSTRVRHFLVRVDSQSSSASAWATRSFSVSAALVSGVVEFEIEPGEQALDPGHTEQEQELEMLDAGSGVLEFRVIPATSSGRTHRISIREVNTP